MEMEFMARRLAFRRIDELSLLFPFNFHPMAVRDGIDRNGLEINVLDTSSNLASKNTRFVIDVRIIRDISSTVNGSKPR